MSSILGNAAAGASAGGAIGSLFPGAGNVIGAGVGAGVGALTGVVSKVFNPNKENSLAPSSLLDDTYVNLGRLGNKKQTRAMDSEARLAALQQYYARQNNQQDMQNTYALTRDSALLEAQGKRNAGLSLAGDVLPLLLPLLTFLHLLCLLLLWLMILLQKFRVLTS